MFLGMLMLAAVALLFLLGHGLWLDRKTRKLLRENQAEWNKIKAEMQIMKTPVEEQVNVYFDYCNGLFKRQDATVGACFHKF